LCLQWRHLVARDEHEDNFPEFFLINSLLP
jgi:hypothetical protein